MPYNKSFIDQASSVKMAGYWPRSRSKRELNQHPAILTSHLVNNIYISYQISAENLNINESFQSLMIISLVLRISEITYSLLTPYSVDQLVSFFNRKINDLLSFMERMDRLLFVHVINSC